MNQGTKSSTLYTLYQLCAFLSLACMVVLQCLTCFQNIHFKRKGTLTQSMTMYLKTSISKESDVNSIYLSQQMFKNIHLKKESDVNPIYLLQHMFKNIQLKKKVMLTQSTITYLKMSTSKEK